MEIGKVLAISDINVRVYLEVENKVKIGDILRIESKNKNLRLEVVEIENLIATTIPFYSVIGLKKGLPVYLEDKGIEMEYSKQALGRVFNSYGELRCV